MAWQAGGQPAALERPILCEGLRALNLFSKEWSQAGPAGPMADPPSGDWSFYHQTSSDDQAAIAGHIQPLRVV